MRARTQTQTVVTLDSKYVIIPAEEYESMLRTIAILQDKKAMKMLRESEEAIRKGRVYKLDDVMKELGV